MKNELENQNVLEMKVAVSSSHDPVPTVNLEFVDEGTIVIMSLNNQKRGNAMSSEMADAFSVAVNRIRKNDKLRVAIVRGAGPDFSIGGERDMLIRLANESMRAEERRGFMLGFYDRWLSFLDLPVPVIAAIEGDCIGVAPIFACASDICLADESANFQITFASIGLFPGMALSYLVPKIVGAQQAAIIMMAAEPFSGREAAGLGLVARSTPKGRVHDAALKLARQIALNDPKTVRALVQTLRVKRSELQPVLDSDASSQAESYGTPEFRRLIANYLPARYDRTQS